MYIGIQLHIIYIMGHTATLMYIGTQLHIIYIMEHIATVNVYRYTVTYNIHNGAYSCI